MEEAGEKLGIDIDRGQRGVSKRSDHERVEEVDGGRGERLDHDWKRDSPESG